MTLKIQSKVASALALGALLGGLYAMPSRAQEAAEPVATTTPAAAETPSTPTAQPAAPVANPAPAPTAAPLENIKPPEPPKQTGPVYNPPPPSGKDWGKLTQENREQVLNEWKALPEKDREPFIFYRERAMAKLPDSAYSDNPYKPETPEAAAAKAAAPAAAAVTPAAEEKSSGGFFDKLLGKDDAKTE